MAFVTFTAPLAWIRFFSTHRTKMIIKEWREKILTPNIILHTFTITIVVHKKLLPNRDFP
jgi:hypothetical protein